ncbi:MAG TPA: glycosyltransferase [Bacteroidia bacterium]|nr:glycosyltransferase [Bacteroidia bacterium]
MKVLLVHKFWRKVGGAEVYFQDVARILRNNNHEVKIFTTDFNAEGSRDVYPKDENVIFGETVDYLKGGLMSRLSNIPEVIYSKKNKAAFKKLLRDFKPDIVHVFAIYVTITPSILDACREEGIPVVMSCNDYKHICPNYRLFHHGKICEDCKGGKFYKAVVNNCCKHSIAVSLISAIESYTHDFKNIWKKNIHTFLFESRFMMNKTEEFWGQGSARLEFLGKPFNATHYKSSRDDKGYILFLGRLSDEKGVDILLHAMKQVPKASLKIAGSGTHRVFLEAMAKKEGITNVEFLGSRFGDELEDLFNNCRFVVVPSLWHENFPYVMMESFARGKAVVGSDKGGIPEYIIPGETGYIFPSHDENALASIVKQLWEDPAKAAEMGLKAKQIADKQFNDETFYQRLSDIYQKVTGKVIKKPEFSA